MKKDLGLFGFLVLLVLIVVGVQIVRQLQDGTSWSDLKTPQFITANNLSNTANIIGQYGVFSIGLGLVIITGGIDLSVGSMLALIGVLLAMSLSEWHWPWPLAAAAVILLPMLLGFAHGWLITRLNLQPFIVTLCGLLIYRGIVRFIADDGTKGFIGAENTDTLRFMASGQLFESVDAATGRKTGAGIPMTFIILMVVAVIAWFVLHRSVYGRYLFAVGRNEQAARFSGINTRRVITSAYVIAGFLTGIAGILIAIYTKAVTPTNHGNFYELYGIAAAVLGGCSLRGGEGSIVGIVLGTIILQVIPNVVNLLGIPSSLDFAVLGTVVLIGVLADEVLQRREKETDEGSPHKELRLDYIYRETILDSKSMSDWIEEGEVAPDFTLKSDDGTKVKLSTLKGSPVVLYFYPEDDTPGCTKEACAFRDQSKELKKLGAAVLGISPDSVDSHVQFRDKFKLNFPLLADEGHKVAEKYGAWREKNMYGNKSMGIQRSTFLIDARGKVAKLWKAVKVDGHDEQVIAALKELAKK